MKKYKHLLLWSSLGVICLLVISTMQENVFKQWRRIQATAKTESGPIDVRLRQIVIPDLNVTDRCVSCHVTAVRICRRCLSRLPSRPSRPFGAGLPS